MAAVSVEEPASIVSLKPASHLHTTEYLCGNINCPICTVCCHSPSVWHVAYTIAMRYDTIDSLAATDRPSGQYQRFAVVRTIHHDDDVSSSFSSRCHAVAPPTYLNSLLLHVLPYFRANLCLPASSYPADFGFLASAVAHLSISLTHANVQENCFKPFFRFLCSSTSIELHSIYQIFLPLPLLPYRSLFA